MSCTGTSGLGRSRLRTATSDQARKERKKDDVGRLERMEEMEGMEGMEGVEQMEQMEASATGARRKYLQTADRLRAGQTLATRGSEVGATVGACHHHQRRDSRSEGKPGRSARRPTSPPTSRPTTSPLLPSSADTADLAQLMLELGQDGSLTREHQLSIARKLRQSVIMDAAEEALSKSRRDRAKAPSHTDGMEVYRIHHEQDKERPKCGQAPAVCDAFYDCLRSLDGDLPALDLHLKLDQTPAKVRQERPTPAGEQSPPFRSQSSVERKPAGRSSDSSSRHITKPSTPAITSATPVIPSSPSSAHVTPRAPSPKHGAGHRKQASSSSSDAAAAAAAAHYQDPEARLKLRLYLASAQKFDEAVQFGFPSNEAIAGVQLQAGGPYPTRAGDGRQPRSQSSSVATMAPPCLCDDRSMTFSEDDSLPPESPKTPDSLGAAFGPVAGHHHHHHTSLDRYSAAPATAREMTLRMTLTRPDLRACEDDIYGFQNSGRATPTLSASPQDVCEDVAFATDVDKFFASLDDEADQAAAEERGVMKRIWRRVRRT